MCILPAMPTSYRNLWVHGLMLCCVVLAKLHHASCLSLVYYQLTLDTLNLRRYACHSLTTGVYCRQFEDSDKAFVYGLQAQTFTLQHRQSRIIHALSTPPMFSRISRGLPAFLTFCFSVIAFSFSIRAITSKNWTARDNYDVTFNVEDWKTPIYTLHRSPFIICEAAAGQNTTYDVSCHRFRPFGFNQTSCELAVATQNDAATNLGDARLCQQIHYAGNFAIASTVFIGLAFLLTALNTLLTFQSLIWRRSPIKSEESPEHAVEHIEGHNSHPKRPLDGHLESRRSVIAQYANLCLVISFAVGVVTATISQFYAILGLVQSIPNNADFASSTAGSNDDINTSGNHGPWYQGKALSVYATVAWGFALASAVMAVRAWRLPRWEKVL